MNICLIAPPLQDYVNGKLMPISMDAARTCPPYGIYLLTSVLESAGENVTLIDLIAQGSSNLSPYVNAICGADLVGIGTSSLSWPTARDCIKAVRQVRPDVPIVLGGIHATMFDEYILSSSEADFIIRGEAEQAFPALCRAFRGDLSLSDVPNLSYRRQSGGIIRNESAKPMSADELAAFPCADYGRIPAGIYMGLGVESSRGCPFDCNFCSTSYRKSWRCLSAEQFADRVEHMQPYLPLTVGGTTQIIDDEFSTNTQRATEICQVLSVRNLSPRLVFSSRANDLTDCGFLEAITPFTQQFLVGAECGYDAGLKRIGKGATCAQLKAAAKNLRKYGIAELADFSFILGLPWETKSEVMQTVQFAYDLHASYGVRVLFQWYCQIPGSRLWAEQRKREILHESLYDDYGFFRNHYLFRSGVALKPSEIFEIQRSIDALKTMSVKNRNGMAMIESSDPYPIRLNYPDVSMHDTSLLNLREVAGLAAR